MRFWRLINYGQINLRFVYSRSRLIELAFVRLLVWGGICMERRREETKCLFDSFGLIRVNLATV